VFAASSNAAGMRQTKCTWFVLNNPAADSSGHFRCFPCGGLHRRTPGPPPFSSMSSTPASFCLPALSWLPKGRTLAFPVFFEELNASSLDGIPNFLSGVFSATQIAVSRLQTSYGRLRNTRVSKTRVPSSNLCKRIACAAPACGTLRQNAALNKIFDIAQRRVLRAFGEHGPF
jgi:hypothetical protein